MDLKQLIIDNDMKDLFRMFIHEDYHREELKTNLGIDLEYIEYDYCDSDCYVVFKAGDKFYKLDGHYSSWSGREFDDYMSFYEVEEAEKMVKYWKEVDS